MKAIWICVLVWNPDYPQGIERPIGIATGTTDTECMHAGHKVVARFKIEGAGFGCFTPEETKRRYPNLEWL